MSRNTREALVDSVDHARIEAADALTNLLNVLTDRRALKHQAHHATTIARRRATNAARALAGAETTPSWPWILVAGAAGAAAGIIAGFAVATLLPNRHTDNQPADDQPEDPDGYPAAPAGTDEDHDPR